MYKSRRRPWVKLYCREWLTSTVRLNLTEQDRSRFIDLLAMAGDSKIPGTVCAGYENGRPIGYPLDWIASTMRCTVPELRKTLEKLAKSDRVTISQTKSELVEMTSPDSNPIIRITGWNKYQSEYLRQIQSVTRNKFLQSSTQIDEQTSASSTQSLNTEGEVEEEGEGERVLVHLKDDEPKLLKDNVKSLPKKFQPPTEGEVASYMAEQGFKNPTDRARDFINYYETLGWVPKGSKVQMKSWKAAVRTWKSRERSSGQTEDPEHERIMLEIEQEAQRRAAQRIQQRNAAT